MVSQTGEEKPLRKASGNRCCGLAGGESREVTLGLECRGCAVTGQCSYGREGMRSESKEARAFVESEPLFCRQWEPCWFYKGMFKKINLFIVKSY